MCVRVCVAPPTCMNRADGFSTSMCFIDAAARCYGGLRAVGFIQPFKWARRRRRRRIVSPLLTLNTLTTYCYSTSTTDSQNYPACSMSAMRNCSPPAPCSSDFVLKRRLRGEVLQGLPGTLFYFVFLLRLCFSRPCIYVRPSICYFFLFCLFIN